MILYRPSTFSTVGIGREDVITMIQTTSREAGGSRVTVDANNDALRSLKSKEGSFGFFLKEEDAFGELQKTVMPDEPGESKNKVHLVCSDKQLSCCVRALLNGRSVELQCGKDDVGLDAVGLLQAVDAIVQKATRPADVVHILLPALDLFIKDKEVDTLASEVIDLLLKFMKVCAGNACVFGHVLLKLALLSKLPVYAMAIALKILTPETDVFLEEQLSLVITDRFIVDSMVSLLITIMQTLPVPVRMAVVKTNIFIAVLAILKEDDTVHFASCLIHKILGLVIEVAKVRPEFQEILLAGNIQATVAGLMARHPQDEVIHRSGCDLFVILSAVPPNKEQLSNPAIFSALKNTINLFKYNPSVLMPALQAVGNLALTCCFSSNVVGSGIHHSVIQCLSDEKVHLICRYQACKVLANMSYMKLQDRLMLVQAGAHLPVIDILRNPDSSCMHLISEACKVLINLTATAASQFDVGSRLIQDGVHGLLIQLMKNPVSVPPCLLFHCCMALDNLSESEEAKVVLIESGAAHCLVNIISHCVQCDKVPGRAMATLNRLTTSNESKNTFISSGAHKAVICLLSSHPCLPVWVVHNAIAVIAALACGCSSVKRALVAAGAVQAILYYMDRYIKEAELQVAACQAIFRISQNGDNKLDIIRLGALQCIRRILVVHGGNGEVHRQALLFLACLSLIETEAKQLVGEAGCIQGVIQSLVSFPHCVDVQILSIIVLLRLAQNSWNLKLLASVHLADLVLAVMKRFPVESDIQNCGSTLLSCLSCRFVECRGDVKSTLKSHQPRLNSVRVNQLCGVAEHVCPNCKDGKASEMIMTINKLPVFIYQQLIERGWFRRGGTQLFAFTSCHSSPCNTAEVRVDLGKFELSKSTTYKRVLKRCKHVTVKTVRPYFSNEAFCLYYNYQVKRHDSENCTVGTYKSHLINSPLLPQTMNGIQYGTFHQEYWIGNRLVGVGVIDVLPEALCSVYMFYHLSPDIKRLSLGVYSALMEIQFAHSLNKQGANIQHYYLGNFNPKNRKLLYKAQFEPIEVMCPHVTLTWQPYSKTACPVFSSGVCPSPGSQSPHHSRCRISRAINCTRQRCRSKKQVVPVSTHKDIVCLVEGQLIYGGDVLNKYQAHPECRGRFCRTLDLLIQMVGPDLAKLLEIELEVVES